ncbi:MAG: hypothetical protein US30_C0009G0027 [Candidatus Moranbacteria bacterium GW2011_GWF2_36_839]|nr:MAG: hypothetical protein US27_C0009G0027 [Candidatus Moranbacteria bacterium GW2011_GWF1_36_78]KKQ16934.1 MAG: hypothetical protein US30_C0009G0027 [Candidatus Moranbacteria bacterium GW2011_GWF2_36_839]HAT73632.1 hypothetical protein [Candidatus Moranbacteria bacterium]HBY10477.1 hypothetical protein [Candidatus Moranbacteria bacterium]
METLIIITSLTILQFLSSLWIKSRLENSIKHEYDKLAEEYKYEIRVREQSSKIAQYLSIVEANRLSPSDDFDFKKANELAWELLLWLPEELYLKLKQALDPKNNAEENNTFKVLLEIRKHLRNENTKITDADVFWHYPNSMKSKFTSDNSVDEVQEKVR